MHIENLPKDVLLFIFSYLPYSQMKEVLKVSRKFRKIGEDPWLWRRFKMKIDKKNIRYLPKLLSLRRFDSLEEIKLQDCKMKNSHVKALMKSKVKIILARKEHLKR